MKVDQDVFNFLDKLANSKRSEKSSLIKLKKINTAVVGSEYTPLYEYMVNFNYPTNKLGSSIIQIGLKNGRVCIRVDEKNREDRKKKNDYYADSKIDLDYFMDHLRAMKKDYEKTTWFIKARLIPSLFKVVKDLLVCRESLGVSHAWS